MRLSCGGALLLLVALAACSEGGRADPGAGTSSAPPNDIVCEAEESTIFGDDVALVCELCGTRGRCVGSGRCVCLEGYDGARCEACAEGYVMRGDNCVTPCSAAGVPCLGLCTGTETDPTCECHIGFEGERCEVCAEGFARESRVIDAMGCQPTCNGECTSDRQCVATSREEQRCECMPSYEPTEDGGCQWRALLADPRFEQGCESWALEKVIAASGHAADAVITDDAELHMSVTHRCSGASASAEAALPGPHTIPNAALAIMANGRGGSTLNVDFGGGPAPFFTEGGEATRLAGTGAWQRYVVCVPPAEAGKKTVLRLSVGSGGECGEVAESRFRVRSIEIGSDPTCQ
jgi:hypothetical protein